MNDYKTPSRPKFYTHDFSEVYKLVNALKEGADTCIELKKIGIEKPIALIDRAKEIGYTITYTSECLTKNPFAPSKRYLRTFKLN